MEQPNRNLNEYRVDVEYTNTLSKRLFHFEMKLEMYGPLGWSEEFFFFFPFKLCLFELYNVFDGKS